MRAEQPNACHTRSALLRSLKTGIGLALLACNAAPPSKSMPATKIEPAATVSAQARANELVRVDDRSLVCMVNNRYIGEKQIPVVVDGKTYFGCCEMCKARLEHDQSARVATDPVSGQAIDKATAVIGRDPKNRVFYFENEATFRRFGGAS